MQNKILVVLAIVSLPSAYGAEKKKVVHHDAAPTASDSAPTTDVNTFQSQTIAVSYSDNRMGFGLQTTDNFVGASNAISMLYDIGDSGTIQAIATIASTSPFNFGVGGFYRHVLMGNRRMGIHGGGGFGLGSVHANGNTTTASTYFNLTALSGFHFSIPQLTNILLAIDAAAVYTHISTTPTAYSSLSIGGLSPALGLSIHYMF